MPKFDMKDHEKKMRAILSPPQMAGLPLLQKLRGAIQRRKPLLPRKPRI